MEVLRSGVGPVTAYRGWDPEGCGAVKGGRRRAIGKHEAGLTRTVGVTQDTQQGIHVGSPSTDQDGEAHAQRPQETALIPGSRTTKSP